MYTRSKNIETISRSTFTDYREKLIDRIDRRGWNRLLIYTRREKNEWTIANASSPFLQAAGIARCNDESAAKIRWFVSRIKDNVERTRIVDRICPISTNRALSIGQALCHRCVGIPVREASTPIGNSSATRGSGDGPSDPGACAGCGNQLREGQALVALDRQWHVWCLKCHSCDTVLHGEYMGKWVKTSF